MPEERKRVAAANGARMAPKRTSPRTDASKSAPRGRPVKRPAKAETPPAAVVPPAPPPAVVPAAPLPAAAPPPVAPTRWTLGGTLIFVLVVLAIAVTVIVGLRLRGHKGFQLKLGVPTPASASDLRAFASPSRPVYWVGPANSGTLEVTRTAGGAVYVRYLPAGVPIGDTAPSYTTIGTYSAPNAYATMKRSAKTPGFKHSQAANGGLAVWRSSRATSVYLAFPKSNYLVEVYDPSPLRARLLALGARVRRVP